MYFQIRSHFEVLGRHEFWGDIIQPSIGISYKKDDHSLPSSPFHKNPTGLGLGHRLTDPKAQAGAPPPKGRQVLPIHGKCPKVSQSVR